MKTRLASTLFLALCALPAAARANGVALEVGVVWPAPQEPALRAIEDRVDSLSAIGLGGAWTVSRIGDFRTDVLASWAWGDAEAHLAADEIRTHLTEHALEFGGRLRWARLYFVQPYVSVRAGPAFGWTTVRGDHRLNAFDVSARIEPAAGFEAFLPFSALGGHMPSLWSRTDRMSGWPGAGLGLGLELGYRFQTPYEVDAEPPTPDDEDVAADAIPRDGPHMGSLTLSGIRMGINVTVRF